MVCAFLCPLPFLAPLARLRQERAEDALRVYSDLQVKQDEVSGSALAVHAAILGATANLENAKPKPRSSSESNFFPKNKRLLKASCDHCQNQAEKPIAPPSAARSRVNAELRACYRFNGVTI